MDNNNYLKKAILAGIISTLIVMFIFIPIIRSLTPLFLEFSSIFFKSYYDQLIRITARGEQNLSSIMTYSYIMYFYALLLIFMSIDIITKFREISTEIKKIRRGDIEKKEVTIEQLENIIKKMKGKIILSVVLTFFALIYIVSVYLQVTVPYSVNINFKQNMATLAPFLSEKEEKSLLSNWALMRTKSDFEQVKEQMNSYAKENNIKLPGSLL